MSGGLAISSTGQTITRVPWTSTTRTFVPAGSGRPSRLSARHSSRPTRTRPSSAGPPGISWSTRAGWPINRREPMPSAGRDRSSRWRRGYRHASDAPDTTTNASHSQPTPTPRKARIAATKAPIANGSRKNEPKKCISPSRKMTAAPSQIHRQVSGESTRSRVTPWTAFVGDGRYRGLAWTSRSACSPSTPIPTTRRRRARRPSPATTHEGVRTVLVCCTGGEEGDILNPAMDRPEVRENIGAGPRRRARGRRPRIIGYDEVVMLGYRDSGMPDSEANNDPRVLRHAPTSTRPSGGSWRSSAVSVRR